MEQNAGFYFGDIARLMRKRFDAAARDCGVTGPQWRLLMIVSKYPGINQGQLAERLEVEPITVCRMVDRMEQAGLLERRADPHDRRARRIHPADNAETLINTLQQRGRHMVATATHDLSKEERETLVTLLERIRANLLNDSLFEEKERSHG
jgi:DNA-binding MarR family transcriptional regulator